MAVLGDQPMNPSFQRRAGRAQGPAGFARMQGPALFVFYLLLVLLAGRRTVQAQTGPPSEYQLKAAFLYNFGKFVEWPANAFTNDAAPLVIGLFGGDPFHGDLERLVANQNIRGHPVIVRQISSLSDLKGCHILFVNTPEPVQAAKITNALGNASILTVTENIDHFTESAFMISFVMKDDKVRFEINNEAARSSGLKISGKLLALALKPAK